MDFTVREARSDDGKADDDLATFSGNRRLEHWLHASGQRPRQKEPQVTLQAQWQTS